MLELQKLIIAILGYLILPPILGLVLARKRLFQSLAFGLLVFMLVFPPYYITFNMESVEWYRGHTKGFEFTVMEMFALALIYSCVIRQVKNVRFFPPGSLIYLFSVLLACTSYLSSYNHLFTSMAVFKFSKVLLLFVAGYNYLQEEKDFRFFLKLMSAMLILHLLVGLWARYGGDAYRVRGWFEHENSMAQWSYFCGLPLLAAALARQTGRRESLLYFAGYGSAGLMVVLSLSRASLAVFLVATTVIFGALLVRRPTVRRLGLATVLAIGGLLVMLVAFDQIWARFSTAGDKDKANDLRWILNEMSAAMVADHPTGVGWNNYGVINSRPYYRYSQMLERWEANRFGYDFPVSAFYSNPLTESLYWCVWAEVGYLGLFGYLLFLIVTYGRMVVTAIAMRGTFIGTVLFGMVVMFTLLYLHSSVERILTQTKNLATWMLVLGMLAKLRLWSKDAEQGRPLPTFFRDGREFLRWLTVDVLTGSRGQRKMPAALSPNTQPSR